LSALDLIKSYGADLLKNGGLLFVIVLTFIQVSPIKVNPWSWLAKRIGKAINGEVLSKVGSLEKEVSTLRKDMTEQAVVTCRVRILRFGDELMQGTHHSKDCFDQTLRDIDAYEKYCREHPDFQNNVTCITVQHIKDVYNKLISDGDFT
jgi:hypothetical protein